MAQTSDTPLGLDQDTPTLDALAPSTHPPLILPEGSFSVPPVLGFAPAPSISADQSAPAVIPKDLPAPVTHPKQQLHMNWYEAVTVALMLGCAALCLYRLLWAIHI